MAIQQFRPINYGLNAIDLSRSLGGLSQALSERQRRKDRDAILKLQQDELKLKEEQSLVKEQQRKNAQEDLNIFVNKENKSAQDYSKMILKYPSLSKQFKDSYSVLSEGKQKDALDEATKIYSALNANKPEIAKSILEDKLLAAENAGLEIEAKRIKRNLDLFDTDNDSAKLTSGLFLASVMGKDAFNKTFETLENQRRERETNPIKLEKAKKELEAFGINAGLKKAQTKKILADTDKLKNETQREIIELEKLKDQGGGIVNTQKRFEAEEKLRKEYTNRTKNFAELERAFDTIAVSSSDATGAGDVALITSFMKMLDPGSVVRETEFATARDTAGLFSQLQNVFTKVNTGEFLTPGQRKGFSSLAKKYMSAAKNSESKVRKQLDNVIDTYKLDKNNVYLIENKTEDEQIKNKPEQQEKSYLKYAR